VVLMEPQHPGNVGAVARAMKNMGLDRLVIVNPPAYDPEQARWMAPGCREILANARIVPSLDEGLQGVHWAVAATARHRKHDQNTLEPNALAERILDGAAEGRTTAVVFGREDHGLTTAEVTRCESVLWIPTPEHASLNLAQAVLVFSNTLFTAHRDRGGSASGRTLGGSRGPVTTSGLQKRKQKRDERADLPNMEGAVVELTKLMERVGYTRAVTPEKVALTVRRSLQSAEPRLRDIDALRGMIARTNWALSNPDKDWTASRNAKSAPTAEPEEA
jgi:TrmH family RNA methyltransferase